MDVWRIARRVYKPLDGEGARRSGARWNSPGAPAIYTASTQSLAILGTLIHVDPDLLPQDYVLYRIHVPDDVRMSVVKTTDLPNDWREPGHDACRTIGDAWLARGSTALLRVPAAPLHEGDECGYVLNPQHQDIRRVTVAQATPFAFDLRLI